MNKPELLACPFCGCAGSLSAFQGSEDENPSAYAFCLDCVVQTRTCIHRDAAVAESLAIAAWNRRTASPVAPEGAAPTPPTSDQRAYPCASCGVMRSASEGGAVFTVCDACWHDTVPSASATTEGPRGETKETG